MRYLPVSILRYLLVLLTGASLLTACGGNDMKTPAGGAAPAITADTTQFTTIQWLDSTNKDFGKIEEGTKLEVSFRFKNTGDKPLLISRVQPSCGCTIAEQSKEPVAPGAEGQVKATFNSEGRTGSNHKTLFVYANTKGSQVSTLAFVVQVNKKQ